MRVLREIRELGDVPGPVVVAAGVFDGMHLGHLAVIGEAVREACDVGGTPVALTFDPHPLTVLRPMDAPKLLTPTPQKLDLMRHAGVQAALVVPFDAAFAATAAGDFIAELAAAARPLAAVCVGEGWRFGRDREGNGELLRTLGKELGFTAVEVPPVHAGNQIVSSTLIRQALDRGDLETSARLLGREFSLAGQVVPGDGLGRGLGSPTANIDTAGGQLPSDGVYAVRARCGECEWPGVANIGRRPTFGGGERRLEVHLLDCNLDLYGTTLEVAFVARLRDERTFDSPESLKAQIASDVAAARTILRLPPG